jgi:hypothetical protein
VTRIRVASARFGRRFDRRLKYFGQVIDFNQGSALLVG